MLTPESISEVFPWASYHAGWGLVTWHPDGVLDNEGADRVVEFLESREQFDGVPFNRFSDMTGYTQIKLGLDHVVRLARRRRRFYKGPPVKSAIFAVRLISLSIARMYEELMAGSQITVCTFRDRAAAAEWLGVPTSVLQRPRK
jgi:hypothetical protein